MSGRAIKFKQFISEGGNAISGKTISRVKRENIKPAVDSVLKFLSKYGVKASDTQLIGSTGKKDDSGDIDLGVLITPIVTHFKSKDSLKLLTAEIKKEFGEAHLAFGNTISFPIKTVNGEFAQMDLMFADDLGRQSFNYHAPHPHESKFKGAHRNIIMKNTIANMTRKGNDESYDRIWVDDGRLYTGSVTTVNGKRVVSNKVAQSHTPEEIIKHIYGKEFSLADSNSFETMYNMLLKSKNFTPAQRDKIKADTIKQLVSSKLEVPMVLL